MRTVVIVVLLLILISGCKEIATNNERCAKIGETIGSCVGCITKCFTGLNAMTQLNFDNKCV